MTEEQARITKLGMTGEQARITKLGMTEEQARITKLGMTEEQARITSKQSWDCHADKSARATNLTGSNRQGGWQFQGRVTG